MGTMDSSRVPLASAVGRCLGQLADHSGVARSLGRSCRPGLLPQVTMLKPKQATSKPQEGANKSPQVFIGVGF